ncbi:MAG: pyridoxine 5'-phosphate synthase [Prevotellaceae bacterium]|jgi:pyridoxine 5-phosphate synthase|nr:pyridoxine 5'-phosphate synthase [Prevotellaceae bacterium]
MSLFLSTQTEVRLSVNINKIATLRNSRGGKIPDVIKAALDCERFGAHGITVHPRPDERHIRYDDVRTLKPLLTGEFNIEGNPIDSFMQLVLDTVPHQVTLVPDTPNQLTSNAGWDVKKNLNFLRKIVEILHEKAIRVSIFTGTEVENIKYAAETGTDRVELYTEPYAEQYPHDRKAAISNFVIAAEAAHQEGLGINAGHDLNLENLAYFIKSVPHILEVSIGHALIADALYLGLENTIQLYLRKIQ